MKYEEFVIDTSLEESVDYYLAGLIEEVGEVARLRRKQLKGTTISPDEYVNELGDVLWYLTALINTTTTLNIREIQEYNMNKLKIKRSL